MAVSMRGKTVVAGHGLRSEGKPYLAPDCNEGDCSIYSGPRPVRPPWMTAKGGHGLCGCGALSGHLETDAARKRWHREHKAEVVATIPHGGAGS